jgi:Virulence protein
MHMSKQLQIRNSTAEFLIFQAEDKEQGVQVFYQDESIWATQDAIATLFDKGRTTITEHLKHIFESGELQEEVVCRKFRLTTQHGAIEGKTQTRDVTFYNLDAIISVGYRVNSIRATQFRRWATGVLRQFAIKGYVLDRKRMENGAFLSEDYFEHLLAEIHEIRLSERRFYQKLTDIYATSMDYDKDAPMTRQFFQMIQNKMHYAVHQHTAAELIMERASAEKEHMGLTTWENAPAGKIVKTDVSIAKNYLKQNELEDMGNIVSAVLDFAETRAKRHIPMTMEDWAKRIDAYLNSDERPLLTDAGSVSHEAAQEYAETEFEKYRVMQDRLFESDFDRFALPTLPFEGDADNVIEDASR